MMDPSLKKPSGKVETNHYPLMAARFWHGMPMSTLAQLFASGKYRNVGLLQWPMVGTAWLCSLINSTFGAVQRARYGKKIEGVKIGEPPLFILGHWRSGTTLLHEYLSLDDAHTSPTTYECFAPAHCLVTKSFIPKLRFLLPDKRPMDNMATGWDRPQEDEFAIMNAGLPSPYRQIAFPNNPPVDLDYLDFVGVSAEDRQRWQATLLWFFKMVAYRSPDKRIILKSPEHLGRIGLLQEMFPNARFVHIVRDPYKVFPSTIKLWKTLYKFQAFQTPKHEGLDEYVFTCFERMYRQFERDRNLVDPGRFHEVRYEDLVEDPTGELEAIYAKLNLGDFDCVRTRLEEYLRANKDYQTNSFQLGESIRSEIDCRWGHWMRPYGYCAEPAAVSL